ncbi:unnamed protein product [Linum tenue]|uniref:Uncharacterized protein n=1 Tax=Linum tenue TaxID=586396 RepID=A0AAV0NB82_9ROSI|nr:unnamed protein product [Linum tenue]
MDEGHSKLVLPRGGTCSDGSFRGCIHSAWGFQRRRDTELPEQTVSDGVFGSGHSSALLVVDFAPHVLGDPNLEIFGEGFLEVVTHEDGDRALDVVSVYSGDVDCFWCVVAPRSVPQRELDNGSDRSRGIRAVTSVCVLAVPSLG